MARRTPYTSIGISRVPCFRCSAPSVHQWTICADNNTFRGLCGNCDVALNRLVLTWMGFDDVEDMIATYVARRG